MTTRLRAIAIVALAAILCWFAVAFTLGMVQSTRNPQMALSWWSYSASARAGLANQLVTKQRSAANQGPGAASGRGRPAARTGQRRRGPGACHRRGAGER